MTSWQLVRLFAGTFILLSLALGIPGSPIFVSPWWLAFTAFVGANLLQSALTKWCLMETILRKLGVRAGRLNEAWRCSPGARCRLWSPRGGCCGWRGCWPAGASAIWSMPGAPHRRTIRNSPPRRRRAMPGRRGASRAHRCGVRRCSSAARPA